MNWYRTQVLEAAAAAEPGPHGAVYWFGRQVAPAVPAKLRRDLPADALRSRRHADLKGCLYRNFYCPGSAVPAVAVEPGDEIIREDDFVERLTRANLTPASMVSAEILGVVTGGVIVRHWEVEFLANTGELHTKEARPRRQAHTILVEAPRDYLSLSPGAYIAVGSHPPLVGPAAHKVRVYWNLVPDVAPRLVASMEQLDSAGIPFRLKIQTAVSPSRCDSAVLYLAEADYKSNLTCLEAIHREIESGLRDSVPSLTRRLTPGVALAQDPGSDESFGEHRCGLLAEGILRSWERRARYQAAKLDCIAETFAEAGVNLDAPDRSARTMPWPSFIGTARPRIRQARPNGDPPACRATRIAEAIADHLCRTAFRHEQRCNWAGASPGGESDIVWQTLGGDLYGGTAGIGAFLASYAAATGDRQAREIAEGAFAHSAGWCATRHVRTRHGLYAGPLGVALAAARAGATTGADSLLDIAQNLTREWMPDERPANDLISGRAGSILALLALDAHLDLGELRDSAYRMGLELVGQAIREDGCWSWPNPVAPRDAPLTGLSHGAAGIAWALYALGQASGEAQFLTAALGALAYERRCFNSDVANWPDMRGEAQGSRHAARQYSSWWCHGAPGIALSRLAMLAAGASDGCYDDALIALRTTRRASEARLKSGSPSFCLCHGIAGNAEVLSLAHDKNPRLFPEGKAASDALLDEGAERFGAVATGWPCGARQGSSPSLMVGHAGIGLAYLRRSGATNISYLSI